MQTTFVIVRAWMNEPVRRVIVARANGLVYISSERAFLARESYPPPIGVDARDVFKFDESSFARAIATWKSTAGNGSNWWSELEAAS
jgi:hypothetical protein